MDRQQTRAHLLSPAVVQLIRPGVLPYQQAWELQRELARQRSQGLTGDSLIMVQHPHTYTFGNVAHPEHLLVSAETLADQGVALVHADRGGDITYHGPGQLVGYPILKLAHYGGDVGRYLRMLEEVIILTLAHYGLQGERIAGLTGVWLGSSKIAAIGVRLSASGVTSHGFALNVDPELGFFQQIVPCGIKDRGVTSLAAQLGNAPSIAEVEGYLLHTFSQVFGVTLDTTS